MKKSNLTIVAIFILIITTNVLFLGGCTTKTFQPISRTEIWLDTPCKITIYDKVAPDVLDKAFEALSGVHNKMNVNSDTSEVSDINKNAGISYVKVSDETFYVVKEAIKYGEITKGKFDITVGPLVNLWGINTEHARLPAPEEITKLLPLVNYKNILLNETDKSVMLKNSGMAIDLGGIAKGYAGDVIAKSLLKNGVKHAVIDLGGNILTVGSKTDGSNWRIGVQNPDFTSRGESVGILSVNNKAIVTSGIYERFLKVDEKIYHHIFDTATGYPVDNNLSSVTIVTTESINGDALAKAFCMGLDDGLSFIEGLKDVDAIFITKNNEVYITSGLKNNFKVSNASFRLMN